MSAIAALGFGGEVPILEVRSGTIAQPMLEELLASPAAATIGAKLAETIAAGSGVTLDPLLLARDLSEARLILLPSATPGGGFRSQVEFTLPTTIDQVWEALSADHPVDAAGVIAINDNQIVRDGAILRVAVGETAALPTALAPGEWLRLDFPALSMAIDDPAFARAIDALHLSTCLGGPGDGGEALALPGARLPLASIDAARLAALPTRPLLVLAVALDADALATAMGRIVDDPAAADGGRAMAAWTDGTAFIALTPSAPFPAVTIGLPSSPAVDALVERFLVGQDKSFSATAADAATVAVAFQKPIPQLLHVRRSAGRWVFGTDGVLHAKVVAGEQGGYVPVIEPGTGVLLDQDSAGMAMLVANLMAVGAGAAPAEQRPALMATMQLLQSVGPGLEPSRIDLRSTAEGAVVDGDSVVAAVGTISVIAGMVVPAVTMARKLSDRVQVGNNLRQLVTACIVVMTDTEGPWPADLETVVREAQIPEKLLVHPRGKGVPPPHILYVRPDIEASASQPVMLENPACNADRGASVCFADGHVQRFKAVQAQRLWDEGVRLAALPQAAADGILIADWSDVGDILGLDPVEPAEAPAEPLPDVP